MDEIVTIQLTPEEQSLYNTICWDPHELIEMDWNPRQRSMETMGSLTESLIERDAIPNVRWRYFADPKFYVGGRGKSRHEVFEGNGTHGRAIFRHSHWIEYLWYFIHGPRLPASSIEGFRRIVEEDRGTSGMVLRQVTAFVRAEVRKWDLERGRASNEFFKLAQESDYGFHADAVRDAALKAR